MIILPTIKPLLAHTEHHHLHHLQDDKNQQKAKVKNHHDQMKHQEEKKSQVKTIVTQPLLINNQSFLTSNFIAPLTLGEYLFLSMITSPFVLYLIKRKI